MYRLYATCILEKRWTWHKTPKVIRHIVFVDLYEKLNGNTDKLIDIVGEKDFKQFEKYLPKNQKSEDTDK